MQRRAKSLHEMRRRGEKFLLRRQIPKLRFSCQLFNARKLCFWRTELQEANAPQFFFFFHWCIFWNLKQFSKKANFFSFFSHFRSNPLENHHHRRFHSHSYRCFCCLFVPEMRKQMPEHFGLLESRWKEKSELWKQERFRHCQHRSNRIQSRDSAEIGIRCQWLNQTSEIPQGKETTPDTTLAWRMSDDLYASTTKALGYSSFTYQLVKSATVGTCTTCPSRRVLVNIVVCSVQDRRSP